MRSSMNVGKGIWRPSMLVLIMALIHGSCKNPEEAMDFLSYVSEVSRGWDEPNSREKGKFPSQPTQNPKGGMYMLSEDMDMKAKVATIARRLEELELKKMHEVQAISETKPMSCHAPFANHLEKPSKFFLETKTTSIPTTSQTQAPQQTSSVEQAIVNLSKVMGDFVGEQKAINSQLHQKIENVESSQIKRMEGMQNDLSQKIDNIQYSISRLTNLNTVNEKGKFPSQPSQNPKGVHEVRQDEELMSKKTLVKESNNQEEKSGKKSASKSSIEEEPRIVIKEDMMKKHMPPPFPQALHGKKEIKNSSEILEVLRQVKVNIPLLDMIKQVPTYAKFLKDLCTVKRGLHVTKNAFLTEQVSAIIQSKSPVKYKDPGCPTISVNIGGTHVEKALLDLGASVNLLPYSVYKQLGLGGLKPTAITLSLADRSVKIPRGVIEDVLVQVDKFYYPVDFVVLDTDPTVRKQIMPIILGRPFLATSNAIINCRNGVMQLTFGNMTLELNIFHLCKRHLHPEEEKDWRSLSCLLGGDGKRSYHCSIRRLTRATVEDPPKLVLKPLPVDLKYAYLEEMRNVQWCSSTLTSDQEDIFWESSGNARKPLDGKFLI
ncbi:hypothetical protein CK203_098486 [Vitis vinifera]|uniref:Uncharacterized protein n=1 Tax=Vitis vinifera TaxID=29760 RepID=A0A438D162_VITVI|nr:hypothetical protein CK203_098486 [Vitis vinifera]